MKILRPFAIASVATALIVPQAGALGGGGFAPGGPMSAHLSPSCNGYNMDGTRNFSPDANRPGCVDRSVDGSGAASAMPAF